MGFSDTRRRCRRRQRLAAGHIVNYDRDTAEAKVRAAQRTEHKYK